MSKGEVQRAQEITLGITDRTVVPSADFINRIYDIVLNMNSLNNKAAGSDGKFLLFL